MDEQLHPIHLKMGVITYPCLIVLLDKMKNVFVQVTAWSFTTSSSGGRLNKKDGLTRYGDSHVKDKTS